MLGFVWVWGFGPKFRGPCGTLLPCWAAGSCLLASTHANMAPCEGSHLVAREIWRLMHSVAGAVGALSCWQFRLSWLKAVELEPDQCAVPWTVNPQAKPKSFCHEP